jgi:Putative MetA-pathway of phenol degradation
MINHRTRFLSGGGFCLLPLVLLLLTARTASSQGNEGREHFQVKVGAFYDQGDFGTLNTTKSLFTPITFRYLGTRYDVSVTSALAQVNTNGGIRLIDGVPTRTGERLTQIRDTRSGVGDTLVRGRFHFLEGGSALPSVTPFFRIKIPTAPENLNLGTGKTDYGFGVEMDKQFSPVLLFGDLGYTVTGKVTGLDLQNRVAGSFGVGGRLSESVILSGLVDWRRSIIKGSENPTELVGVITYRLSPTVTVSPNAYFGLNNSSPDFGGGVELSFRFGRY